MSLFDLTDKVAIVTGSSRGIGRAIALRMAASSHRIAQAGLSLGDVARIVDHDGLRASLRYLDRDGAPQTS